MTRQTKPFLMGFEVEYSMSARHGDQPLTHGKIHELLLSAIRQRHCWLRDARNGAGIYLDNGARYYLDVGGHNEFCSPELMTPRQVAVYDRAAEQILIAARDHAMRRHWPLSINITKNNVNFGMSDDATWGQHESYTCWASKNAVARQLIPHLVSRIPYAGAGNLCADPRGMGFELSQRARHMTREMGSKTTQDRAIFCTRGFDRSENGNQGWTRLHLICKDSQRCSFGMYLTYGTTALLLMILNQGYRIGYKLRLADAVSAMRTLSLDPWLKSRVPLQDGRRLTAVEIQREYLTEAESYVANGEFPDWASEVIADWTHTLDQLESNPMRLSQQLDTYLKFALFDHQLQRAGYDWKQLAAALQVTEQMRRAASETVLQALLNESPRRLDREARVVYAGLAKHLRANCIGAEQIRFALRLQALELKYHELGGFIDQLAMAGRVDHLDVTPDEVRLAMHQPPDGGRAAARSRCINSRSGDTSWICDWQGVVDRSNATWYDMRDPFANADQLITLSRAEPISLHPLAHMIPF